MRTENTTRIAILAARGGVRHKHLALVLAYVRENPQTSLNRVGLPSTTSAPPQCQTTSHRVLRAEVADFPLFFIGAAVFMSVVAAGATIVGLWLGVW